MAFYEFDRTAEQNANIRQLKQTVVTFDMLVRHIQRQAAEMTDEQIRNNFGAPMGIETAFKNNLSALLISLETDAFQQIISQMGFTK